MLHGCVIRKSGRLENAGLGLGEDIAQFEDEPLALAVGGQRHEVLPWLAFFQRGWPPVHQCWRTVEFDPVRQMQLQALASAAHLASGLDADSAAARQHSAD